jgi:trimethylamine--corrinoid protein Co-methyltransferase
MDLRSSLCSFGSPNQILIGLAAAQLARFYGFYTGVNCALTDACVPDFQAGFEKGSSAMTALLAGVGFGAQGIIGADQGTGFEQLVLDNEWASALNHIFSHGVMVNDDTLGVDAIKRVGILGSFLVDDHTIKHMRNTYWKSSVFNYESWDSWMAKGGKDAYSRAHAEVERILHAHYPPQVVVSPEVQAEMKTIVDEAIDLPELFETGLFKYTYLL